MATNKDENGGGTTRPRPLCSRARDVVLTSVGRTSAAAHRLVFMVLASYADAGTLEAYPSVDTLAKDTHLDRATVKRVLRGLELQGATVAVDRRSKGGRDGDGRGITTRWRLVLPRDERRGTGASGTGKPVPQVESTGASGPDNRFLRHPKESLEESIEEGGNRPKRKRPRSEPDERDDDEASAAALALILSVAEHKAKMRAAREARS